MPTYEVYGDIRIAFVHTVDANDKNEARDMVARLRLSEIDSVDCGETEPSFCIKIDANGDEIE
jgi:hypothetical protein